MVFELPSFVVDKVQYQFSGTLMDLVVSGNVMFVLVFKNNAVKAEDGFELIEIDLSQASAVKGMSFRFIHVYSDKVLI